MADPLKIMICGNGGLAAEAEHFSAELMGKYAKDVYVPCIALTTNSALVTALANDMGYENVFAHQVKVLGEPCDILIAMTTSNSPNIKEALRVAREKGMLTIALCGMKSELTADYILHTVGEDTAQVQEGILARLHYMARCIKEAMNNAGCEPQQQA